MRKVPRRACPSAWLATAALLAIAVAAAASTAGAQERVIALAPGTPVRVWTRPQGAARWALGPPQHAGRFVGMRGDTLLLQARSARGPGGAPAALVVTVPRTRLTGLEARLPAHNATLGVVLGLAAGAAAGALSARAGPVYCHGDVVCDMERAAPRGAYAAAGGAAGALLGGVIGWRVRTLQWQTLMDWR